MQLSLPEIQMTYFVIISLLTFCVAFIVPRHIKKIRVFVVARRLLITGGILVSLHFLLQYVIHKNPDTLESTRLLFNLLFGFPSSFFFCMSLLYLLRRGEITMREWITVPLIYMAALLVLSASLFIRIPITSVLPILLVLYGIVLVFYSIILVCQFVRMKRRQRNGDHSGDLVLKWTQLSVFFMSGIGLGYPFILVINNVTARSVYGIMSLFAAFIFILGLMGYALNYSILVSMREDEPLTEPEYQRQIVEALRSNKMPRSSYDTEKDDIPAGRADASAGMKDIPADTSDTPTAVSPGTVDSDDTALADTSAVELSLIDERIERAIDEFCRRRLYLRPGITIGEAAGEMGIPPLHLRHYLRRCKSTKFNTWIMQQRVEYSKQLLIENPGMSNDVIALQCGMCDRQYYQVQFLKYVGTTPSKWIKSHS